MSKNQKSFKIKISFKWHLFGEAVPQPFLTQLYLSKKTLALSEFIDLLHSNVFCTTRKLQECRSRLCFVYGYILSTQNSACAQEMLDPGLWSE